MLCDLFVAVQRFRTVSAVYFFYLQKAKECNWKIRLPRMTPNEIAIGLEIEIMDGWGRNVEIKVAFKTCMLTNEKWTQVYEVVGICFTFMSTNSYVIN